MLYRMMPSRKVLFGNGEHFEENLKHLRLLRPKMQLHISKVDKFLKENGLDNKAKV